MSAGAPVRRHSVRFGPGRAAARLLLGSALVFAGVSHLSFARQPFHAQVPPWFPMDPDTVVLGSGVVEIALGTTIAIAPERHRRAVGSLAALFFTAIYPGNIAQYQHHRDSLGLDTDRQRLVRLFGQPVLVAWPCGRPAAGADPTGRERP